MTERIDRVPLVIIVCLELDRVSMGSSSLVHSSFPGGDPGSILTTAVNVDCMGKRRYQCLTSIKSTVYGWTDHSRYYICIVHTFTNVHVDGTKTDDTEDILRMYITPYN